MISKLSESQQNTMDAINNIVGYFGKDRWFIKEELSGVGYTTLMALVNKGYLQTQYFGNVDYYKIKDGIQ